MREKYKISVIIPIYNSSKFIKRCINTLAKQDFKMAFEIIFVDSGSTDGTLETIQTHVSKNDL